MGVVGVCVTNACTQTQKQPQPTIRRTLKADHIGIVDGVLGFPGRIKDQKRKRWIFGWLHTQIFEIVPTCTKQQQQHTIYGIVVAVYLKDRNPIVEKARCKLLM